jgi:hypothetical protein
MGIGFSSQRGGKYISVKESFQSSKFPNVLDHIATKYILEQNFKDLENLHDKNYCNKLVVLTSKIIKNYFNNIELNWLDQRTSQGKIIDKMTDNQEITYLTQENLQKMQEITPLRKQRMCIGIAKFYVKVGHLFAAITKTINPLYTYIDELGMKKTVELKHKDKIKTGATFSFKESNLCSKRIKALMVKQNSENGIVVQNKSCSINQKGGKEQSQIIPPSISDNIGNLETLKKNTILPKQDEEILDTLKKQVKENQFNTTLNQETGIPELEKLYWDDYDFTTGKYKGMLPETKKIYLQDVHTFYKVFTGNDVVPEGIQTFSNIPLKDFQNQKLCAKVDSNRFNTLTQNEKTYNKIWKQQHGPSQNDIFKTYAAHLSEMMRNAKSYEKKLKDILGEIFVYWVDEKNDKKTLTINPELNMSNLDKLIVKSRNIIVELYISCEKNFKKGLGLFEAIAKQKIFETRKRKDEHLMKLTKNVV